MGFTKISRSRMSANEETDKGRHMPKKVTARQKAQQNRPHVFPCVSWQKKGWHRWMSALLYEKNSSQQFNPKESPDHLKWLHTAISNLKTLIVGTYHGLDSKHLQAYFNEYCYRFNRRKFKGQLFNRLLNACIGTTTITYRQLVDGAHVLTWYSCL